MVCSSYDGSDYDNYYDFRADINIYKITDPHAINGVLPYLTDDIVWGDKNTLALKVYTKNRTDNGKNLNFKYLKTSFK